MVPGRHEGIIEPAERTGADVVHGADLAMNHRRCAHDSGAIGDTDRLVAEAHAEHRHGAAERPYEGDAHARLLGDPRTRGHHDRGWIRSRDVLDGQRIVALDHHRCAELSQVLHEVERERVVVVDDQHLATQR